MGDFPYEGDYGDEDDAPSTSTKKGVPWGMILTGILLASLVVGPIIWGIVGAVQSSNASGRARDSFVAVRLAQVASSVAGGTVKVDKESAPRWDGTYKTMNVTLTLGSCSGIEGYMTTPNHPKSLNDVSSLYVVMPGPETNPYRYPVDANVLVTDSHFFNKLRLSALAHCVG